MKNNILALILLALPLLAHAQTQPAAEVSATRPTAAFVYHPATGTVLVAENATARMGPASLTKLMTLYLTFDALKSGKLTMQTQVPVSEKAWRTEGSKMFIEVGKQVAVEDLIRGISIVSGNDACVAMAEALGGSEEGFAQMMNAKAAELGMQHTHYVNANGLPDANQYTTAQDVALLLTALFRDFPEYKHFLAEEEFTYNNIKQQNRNGLLHAGLGIDAGKTGHTEESGYHLASTAVENGERLVVVVMGRSGFADREQASLAYYRNIFATHATKIFFKPGDVVIPAVPVWHGNQQAVALTVSEPVGAYLNTAMPGQVRAQARYGDVVIAPAAADKPLGELTVALPSGQTQTVALVPLTQVDTGGFLTRYWQSLTSKLGG